MAGPSSRNGSNRGGRDGNHSARGERSRNESRRNNARNSGAGGRGGRNNQPARGLVAQTLDPEYLAWKKNKEAMAQDPARRLEYLESMIRDNPNANADQKAAWITEAEGLRYEQYYRTENQRLMGELEKSPLLDAARAEAKTLTDNGFIDADDQARVQRMAGRQGLSITSGQQQALTRANQFNNANTVTSMLDKARLAEQTRKDGLRGELINLGRGIATSGTQGLTQAAANQTQRDNTNAQIKAQNSAAKKQGIGSLAGAGIGFAVGGPVGGAIGAGIGSTLGRMF